MRCDLSPGLLTEVQCQSKRLRKGGKARGQEEEEQADSRRVSSSSRLPAQVRDQQVSGLATLWGPPRNRPEKVKQREGCCFIHSACINRKCVVGVLEPLSMVTEGEVGMLPGYCSLLCCRVFPDLFNVLKKCSRCVRDVSVSRLVTLKPPQNCMIGQWGEDCPESSVVKTSHDCQYDRTYCTEYSSSFSSNFALI